jgi:hypothetical protein
MLMYEIFKSLGLTVRFRHVVSDCGWAEEFPVVGLEPVLEVWPMEVEGPELVFDDWSGRDGDERRYIDSQDVHWLNDWGHQEPQLVWISVSDHTQLKGSIAADSSVS